MSDLQYTCFQEHNFETLSFENVKEISEEILTWFGNNDLKFLKFGSFTEKISSKSLLIQKM